MSADLSPRLAEVVEALPLCDGMRVLEIGCGPGAAARAVAVRIGNGHVLAIDRSAKAIGQARDGSADLISAGRTQPALRCRRGFRPRSGRGAVRHRICRARWRARWPTPCGWREGAAAHRRGSCPRRAIVHRWRLALAGTETAGSRDLTAVDIQLTHACLFSRICATPGDLAAKCSRDNRARNVLSACV